MSTGGSASPFIRCPAGVWTTVYRGALLPAGYFKIRSSNTPVRPEFEYEGWSTHPIFYCKGSSPAYTETQIWIGPTWYAELKVKPKVDSYFHAWGT